MSVPAYDALQVRTDLDSAVSSLAQSYRRAQVLSQSGNGDTSWGVRVATGSILIYKGASYASRDMLYDENTSVSPSILFGGISEVTFSRLYGLPNLTGTTTLTSARNETRTIIINQKGSISY